MTPTGNRKTIRLQNFDYSSNCAYFITLCSHNKRNTFSTIENGIIHPSPLGQIITEHWSLIPNHYPGIELGEYCVMPNHFHGILLITDSNFKKTVGQVLGMFKSIVTKKALYIGNGPLVWQRNYYEHILRSDAALQKATDYILENPLHWDKDDENSTKSSPHPSR